MYCPKCGNKCNPDTAFCSACGAKIKKVQQEKIPSIKKTNSTHNEKKFSYIENVLTSRTHTTDTLLMHPPPMVKTQDHGINYKDDENLSSIASDSGFFYYSRNHSKGSSEKIDTTTRIVTIISMIFVFLMVGGPSVKGYISVYTAFRKTSGIYTDEKYNYSMYFQDGWKTMKKPRKMLRVENAAGFFAKGNPLKPDIQMMIYYGGSGVDAPEIISPDILDFLEPEVKRSTEYYANMMGMNYQLMGMNLIKINNRDALWIEGNFWCKGCEIKRDFTFYAFGGDSSYYIKFVFADHQVEKYWPEIREILDSITLE